MSDKLTLSLILTCLFCSVGLLLYFIIRSLESRTSGRQKIITGRWSADFSNLFIFLNAEHLFWFHCAATLIIPVALFMLTGQYILAGCLAIGIAIAPEHIITFAKKRRLEKFDNQLPDSLMQISGALKAGASLLNAIELLSENTRGPVGQEFGLVVREYRMGTPVEQAMRNIEKRVPSSNLGLMVTTATIAQDTGGNLSESLERLAVSSRQQLMIEKKIHALTSQGKLQGIVVGLLPVGIGLVLAQIESEAMAAIFNTWLGYGTIFLIIILEALGLYCIKKVVAIDV